MSNRDQPWEHARQLAHQLAARTCELRGEALWLRDYPASTPGDVGQIVLGVARRGVHRSCAVVSHLGAVSTITAEVRRGGTCALLAFRGTDAGVQEAAAVIAAALETPGASSPAGLDADAGAADAGPALDEEAALRRRLRLLGATSTADQRPGLLDAGYAALDGLGQQLAVPGGRWALELWGHDQAASGVSVSLRGGDHAWPQLVMVRADGGGATLRVPGAALGAPDHVQTAPTVAELAAQLAAVVSLVRAAVDGRAAFRARPRSAHRLAEQLAHELRARGGIPSAAASGERDQDFPRRWPSARVVERLAGDEHVLIELQEQAPAPSILVTVDDLVVLVRTDRELEDHLPALLERSRQRAARLTPQRLGTEQIYQVLEPFLGLARGLRLRFAGRHGDPRGEVLEYRFTVLGDGTHLALVDGPDNAVLDQLHRHLAPVR